MFLVLEKLSQSNNKRYNSTLVNNKITQHYNIKSAVRINLSAYLIASN